ncbi:MAG: hypothetical protein L6R40_006748 [Gallowayella cf. fulva]|nr:MAG: hypothetical protein L6R40_006748 [Xanthomendoza cf. fulva]
MVQPVTLDKIIEWRDEKDEPDAVEDILREVIVIPDDEDEESEDDPVHHRQNSAEVISSHEFADNVHVQPLDYGALDEEIRSDRPVSPEDDWAPSVKFLRRIPTPAGPHQRHQASADRQQAHRKRIWQEAVSRRRDTGYTRQDLAPQPAKGNRDLDYLRQIQGYKGDLARPSTGAYNYVQKPDEQVHMAGDRYNHKLTTIPRVSKQGNPWPPLTLGTDSESERLMPSVEDGQYTMHREGARVGSPEPSTRQFQDGFVGPRIVELDNDPHTPILKRRRFEDVDWVGKFAYRSVTDIQPPRSSALVQCRPPLHASYPNPDSATGGASLPQALRYDQGPPRHVELVPIAREVHNGASDGFADAVVKHRDWNTLQPFSGVPPRMEPHVNSPLHQPQFRSREGFPAVPRSPRSIRKCQPPFDSLRPQQPSHHPYVSTPMSYAAVSIPEPDSTHFVPRTNHGLQESPVRPRPLYTSEENIARYPDRKAGVERAGEGFRPPHSGMEGYACHPPHYSRQGAQMVEESPQSFNAAPPRHVLNAGSSLYAHEELGQTARGSRMTAHHTIYQEPEVVYITSSPLADER